MSNPLDSNVAAQIAVMHRVVVEERRWLMAFMFGLIHGFGFASVLADLGLPRDALLLFALQ